MELPKHIIFIDGECNLCNGFVQFIIKRDKNEIFHFAHLQASAKFFAKSNFQLGNEMASVVFLEKGTFYTHSDAALRIFTKLGGGYRLLNLLGFLPKGLKNAGYNLIARNRYKWFGKKDECLIPNESWNQRFLNFKATTPKE